MIPQPESRPPAGGRRAGSARAAGGTSGLAAEPRVTAEQLDQVGNHLAMAGLRLARLRTRLESTEDRLTLIQARSDLDEAIAEVRRLALSARQREGS